MSEERSDGEVVAAVLDGESDDFRVLVDRYEDPLYRHLCRMAGSESLAAELLQKTFIRSYRRLEQCREPERVGGWMFRIASNICKDHLKGRGRDDVALEDAPPVRAEGENPEAAAERGEMRVQLEEALQELTPEKREAFLLKHLEEYTYTEISERLGVSASAAKMRVHRAREELQELLEERP